MTVDIEARARELVRDYARHVFRSHGTPPPEDVFLQNAIAAFAREIAEECARMAWDACLVPPDGGSPTADEARMCDEIADAIRTRFNLKESDRG